MHPYLFPWILPSGALAALAYLAAVGAAATIASWFSSGKGRGFSWGKFLPVFVVLSLIGVVVVGRNLPFEPQPIPLHTYGLMIALGFLLAAHLAARASERYATLDGTAFFLPGAPAVARAQKQGGSEAVGRAARQHFLDLTVWIFVGAMIGARGLFILVNWGGPNGYGANPARIFSLSGGLVFYGGFIGAAVAAVLYARKHRLNFRGIADIAIPGVALGHFFGRLGCMSAGCCWGKVCADPAFALGAKFPEGSLAYKEMLADPAHQDFLLQHGHTPALHPTQMYEGMGELALFFLLLQIRKGKRFHGQVFVSWLVLYAILRLSIETFRGDWGRGMLLRWPEANPLILSTSQLVGLGMITMGLVLFLLWRPGAKAGAAAGAVTPG